MYAVERESCRKGPADMIPESDRGTFWKVLGGRREMSRLLCLGFHLSSVVTEFFHFDAAID